jgi:NADPH-dependent ferric siderophore reductase
MARAYPAYRPYEATVQRTLRLSPHFLRVTFTGEDFGCLGTAGLDQRIKILFPSPDGAVCDVGADDHETILTGAWYQRWRELPEEQRGALRTYTVRSARPDRRELDVDMVLHEPSPEHPDGPAAAWLRRAAVGDRVVVVGPDARSADPAAGLDWRPGTARHLLLVGDETAAPAICSIVESLRPGVVAQAFIEVPTGADILNVMVPGGSQVTWVARDAGCVTAHGFQAVAPHGLLLHQALSSWLPRHLHHLGDAIRATPDPLEDVDVDVELLWDRPLHPATGDFYAWIAGEAAVVRSLRRYLVGEVGVDRRNIAFMGYWRRGRSEGQ